jgi:hypothetical protein
MRCDKCGAEKLELMDGQFIEAGRIMEPVPIDMHGESFKSTGILKYDFHCKECLTQQPKEPEVPREAVSPTDW